MQHPAALFVKSLSGVYSVFLRLLGQRGLRPTPSLRPGPTSDLALRRGLGCQMSCNQYRKLRGSLHCQTLQMRYGFSKWEKIDLYFLPPNEGSKKGRP